MFVAAVHLVLIASRLVQSSFLRSSTALPFILPSSHRRLNVLPSSLAIRRARNINRIARVVRDQIVVVLPPHPLSAIVVVGSNRSSSVVTVIADTITAETVNRGRERVPPTSCICTHTHPDFTADAVVIRKNNIVY